MSGKEAAGRTFGCRFLAGRCGWPVAGYRGLRRLRDLTAKPKPIVQQQRTKNSKASQPLYSSVMAVAVIQTTAVTDRSQATDFLIFFNSPEHIFLPPLHTRKASLQTHYSKTEGV
jgi:hypothetical protein